jgi:MOSC domain-containing protein YiiM
MNKLLLLSIQVGLPKTIRNDEPSGSEGDWTTGFFKEPAQGPLWLGKTNLAGDGQADLKNHGGPDKAVNAYPSEHYAFWREETGKHDLTNGAFGENFTTEGLLEETVCIGDLYAVGKAKVQVSQARQPCWKIDRRLGIKDLARLVQDTGRTGWYFRVIQEGMVSPGALELLERPCPEWTLARANDIMHRRIDDKNLRLELSRCPHLSASWRNTLSESGLKSLAKQVVNRLKG